MNLRIVRLAYWLIRLRWYAILGIVFAYFTAKQILNISIWLQPVYYIVLFLIILNVISFSFLKYLQKSHIRKSLKIVNGSINFQISTDLIFLTLLLHYSGGVENPFIVYYIFHMIIGSIILTTRESLIQTSFALMLVGAMTFLEYSGVIEHYPLSGFIETNIYSNLIYLVFTGLIFISTSYFVVYITRTIVIESQKHQMAYLQANIKLKQNDKIKNEYVMRITHDIKGHINAIQSCIVMLRKKIIGPLNMQQEELVNRSYDRIRTLNMFISNLLSITQRKLEHKSNFAYFDLIQSINEVLKLFETSIDNNNISISRIIEPGIGNIFGEKDSIKEVLSNLISNAIKYSPSGSTISIHVHDKQDKVLVQVIDEGIGIPEEEIHQVFNEFFRASNVKTQTFEGTGLGLAISKQIIENHGGKIWVESKLNEGTRFSILIKKDK